MKERGEKVNDSIIEALLTGNSTLIETRWVGDIKRTTWGRLKRNACGIGGNFRLNVWDTEFKRNVTYIDPLPARFDNDVIGKKNAFFDAKPATTECKRQRKENKQDVHPLIFQEFQENIAMNGRYIEPEPDLTVHIKTEFKKERITQSTFDGYLGLIDMYHGEYHYSHYVAFKAGNIEQAVFNERMDSVANFSDKSCGGSLCRSGMFANFVKRVPLFSCEYEKRVKEWCEIYGDSKKRGA